MSSCLIVPVVDDAAYLSSEAQSLVKALLTREPSKRLGHGPTGSADVQKHPFFRSIKWDALMRRQVSICSALPVVLVTSSPWWQDPVLA